MPKVYDKLHDVIITPTLASAGAVVEAGADIVAVDCTLRQGRTPEAIQALLEEYKAGLDVLIMAEISTAEEGRIAAAGGADIFINDHRRIYALFTPSGGAGLPTDRRTDRNDAAAHQCRRSFLSAGTGCPGFKNSARGRSPSAARLPVPIASRERLLRRSTVSKRRKKGQNKNWNKLFIKYCKI